MRNAAQRRAARSTQAKRGAPDCCMCVTRFQFVQLHKSCRFPRSPPPTLHHRQAQDARIVWSLAPPTARYDSSIRCDVVRMTFSLQRSGSEREQKKIIGFVCTLLCTSALLRLIVFFCANTTANTNGIGLNGVTIMELTFATATSLNDGRTEIVAFPDKDVAHVDRCDAMRWNVPVLA